MSTQHNGKQLSSSKIQEKNILAGETLAYPLHDKDKSVTEGKITVRPSTSDDIRRSTKRVPTRVRL